MRGHSCWNGWRIIWCWGLTASASPRTIAATGPTALLAALDRAGYIAHVPNVLRPGDIPQHAGYEKIRATQGIDRAEWLMMLDADEFLNVHVGDGRVADLTGTGRAGCGCDRAERHVLFRCARGELAAGAGLSALCRTGWAFGTRPMRRSRR